MAESITIDFDDPVPLFPLPTVALLPHATIPLHVFEPRYRRLVADALKSRRLVAMATFAGDDWREDYDGSPPLRPHVCVGRIVRHERLGDGRFNVLLQGVCRARIVEEPPHQPYRLGLLEPTERRAVLEIDLAEGRHRLETMLRDPLLKQLASVSAVRNWLSDEVPTAALADLAILAIFDQAEDRYRMLCEADPSARVDWLERRLRQTRRTVAVAGRFEPARSDEGVCLN